MVPSAVLGDLFCSLSPWERVKVKALLHHIDNYTVQTVQFPYHDTPQNPNTDD